MVTAAVVRVGVRRTLVDGHRHAPRAAAPAAAPAAADLRPRHRHSTRVVVRVDQRVVVGWDPIVAEPVQAILEGQAREF